MFKHNDKQQHYGIFLNSIDMWRKGEIREIREQTLESTDKTDMDSYTIFQQGKLHGDFRLNENIRFHNTFIINNKNYGQKQEQLIYQHIINFIQKRIDRVSENKVLYKGLEQDIERLQSFVSIINNINLLAFNLEGNVLKEIKFF